MKTQLIREFNSFLDGIASNDPAAKLKRRRSLNDTGQNWFVTFVPSLWGRSRKTDGVHWGLIHRYDKSTDSHFLRLSLGVESPLAPSHIELFKKAVLETAIENQAIPGGFETWPNAGIRKGTKLLEAHPIPVVAGASETALEAYVKTHEFNAIVGEHIRQFYKAGHFVDELDFVS